MVWIPHKKHVWTLAKVVCSTDNKFDGGEKDHGEQEESLAITVKEEPMHATQQRAAGTTDGGRGEASLTGASAATTAINVNIEPQTVQRTAVHPFDPTHLLNLDNLCYMNNLHEAPLLDLLRRRFFESDIYTYTGDVLISLNPYATIPGLYDAPLRYLRLHNETVMDSITSSPSSLPSLSSSMSSSAVSEGRKPHVYQIANNALKRLCKPPVLVGAADDNDCNIKTTVRNQSIIVRSVLVSISTIVFV